MAYEPTPAADLTVADGGAGSEFPSTLLFPGRAIPLLPHQLFDDFRYRLQDLLPPDGSMAIFQQPTRRHIGDDGTAALATAPPSPDNSDNDDDDDFDFMPPPKADDGVPEEVVARFLETVASDGGKHGLCAVCLDDLHGEDRTVGVLRCRHGFHGECIGKWLQKKNVCPLCRAIVVID